MTPHTRWFYSRKTTRLKAAADTAWLALGGHEPFYPVMRKFKRYRYI